MRSRILRQPLPLPFFQALDINAIRSS